MSMLLADSELPFIKGLAMILFFGGVGVFATLAACVSNQTLRGWSTVIGTENPLFGRVVCIIAAIVGWTFVGVTIASLSGVL